MKVRNVILIAASALATMTVVRGGHELPVYPSYYPHEIEIATVAPERAAPLLLDGKIHAFVGSAPRFTGAPPDRIQLVESLGSLVAVRINPESPHAQEEMSACMAVRAIAEALSVNSTVVIHPYPVTPFHGDYLHHVDRAAHVRESLLAASLTAPSLQDLKVRTVGSAERLVRGNTSSDSWDVEVREVSAASIVALTMTATNGWLGPPALKSGWYQAYLVLRDQIDPNARERIEAQAQRLLSADFADAVERINVERDFVMQLIGGCRNVVIGYTVKPEYFNAEFSAGVENVGYDSLTGFNSGIFLRTVKLKDFPWNGWLALGIDARPQAAWNPVAGFTDPFGRLMWSALSDPAMLPAPYGSGWMINRISDVQPAPSR